MRSQRGSRINSQRTACRLAIRSARRQSPRQPRFCGITRNLGKNIRQRAAHGLAREWIRNRNHYRWRYLKIENKCLLGVCNGTRRDCRRLVRWHILRRSISRRHGWRRIRLQSAASWRAACVCNGKGPSDSLAASGPRHRGCNLDRR